eukprot:m.137635 g.137635  ORF g.137635 m.137635 type:complete len:562 (+) comp12058_c0_seq1:169-1854(+)
MSSAEIPIDQFSNNGCGDGMDGRVGGIIAVLTFLLPFAIFSREIALVHKSSVMSTMYNILLAFTVTIAVFFFAGYALSNGFLPNREQNNFLGERFFFFIGRDVCSYMDILSELSRFLVVVAIVFGAATERIHSYAVTVLSISVTGFIFAVPRYWTAGDNSWLLQNGKMLQDTAGNGTMFFSAGLMATILVLLVHPRSDQIRFAPFFSINNPTGLFSSTVMHLIGCIFMISFSSSRRVSAMGDNIAIEDNPDARALKGAVNVVIAAAFGGLSAVGIQRYVERNRMIMSPQLHIRIATAGALAGIVSVSSFATVSNPELIIPAGIIGGIVCRMFMLLIQRKNNDDATDAGPIYLGGGLVALLAAPFWDEQDGIFYHLHAWDGLGWNIVCIVVIVLWIGGLFGTMCMFLNIMNLLTYPKDQLDNQQGLDVTLFSMDMTMMSRALPNQFGFHAGAETPAPARGKRKGRIHHHDPHNGSSLDETMESSILNNSMVPPPPRHGNRNNNDGSDDDDGDSFKNYTNMRYSPIPEDSREVNSSNLTTSSSAVQASFQLPGGILDDNEIEL